MDLNDVKCTVATASQVIDKFVMHIRMSEWEELVGADFAEHGIRRRNVGVSRAVSVLGLQHNGFDYNDILPQGDNPCMIYIKILFVLIYCLPM